MKAYQRDQYMIYEHDNYDDARWCAKLFKALRVEFTLDGLNVSYHKDEHEKVIGQIRKFMDVAPIVKAVFDNEN
jgi:hypothetical protein